MKNYWVIIFCLVVAGLLLLIRFTAYEPIGYSISNYDTDAYIAAGRMPFFSTEFFTSNRPPTIGLLYKVLEPSTGYLVTALSSPAEDIYKPLAIQPGLDRVAFAQSLLSIAGWVLLAVVVARRLVNPGLQVIAVLLILGFAFSPSLVEWDYNLLSEPISLSLFAVFLAISIELTPKFIDSGEDRGSWINPLVVGWFIVLVLWVFARDSNAYLLPIFILGIIALLVVQKIVKNVSLPKTQILVMGLISLTFLFLVHNLTFQKSDRWINPFFNNMIQNVLPYPDRISFFENIGMPFNDEVLALPNTSVNANKDQLFKIPELMSWLTSHGTGPYIEFMIAYSDWTIKTLVSGVEFSFSENRQPFFLPSSDQTLQVRAYFSDLFHPRTSSVVWVGLVEMVVLGFLAIYKKEAISIALFLLFGILFLSEFLMLIVSILGDASSIVRHAIGPVTFFRLSVWLLPMFILDLFGFHPNSGT